MELSEEFEVSKKCYKLEHHLLDSLNIFCNTSSSVIVLWNKFQLFVYEDLNFEDTSKIIVPEFQVHQLLMSNNYLICLDCCGNVHSTSLKFKNPAQKRFRNSFQPRLQVVVACTLIQDSVLSLKYENGTYYLYLNKVSADFQLENKIRLNYSGSWPLPAPVLKNSLLSSYKLTTEELSYVTTVFNVKETVLSDYCLNVLSFDKLSVYICLTSPKGGDAILIKAYSCPSEICNIEIVNHDGLNIVIGLKIGTLVRLSLKQVSSKAAIVHLNKALYKYLTFNNTLVYTDGISLWKSNNVFQENIDFSQFFVKNIKDFIKYGDQIVCTSFTNMLYMFSLEDGSCFMKQNTSTEYCPAEKILNNSECLYRIMEEVEKNNEITKKINNEENYLTAFSISKRQDVMDNILSHSVKVYETYEDVMRESFDITLTEDMLEYFKPNSFYFLVKLTAVSLHHIFKNILSNLLNDVKIHLSLSTDEKLLKITSLKVAETFKKMNILLPVEIRDENIPELNLNIKLVSSIPGAFDEKQKLWVTLYRQQIVLKSEHFIKPSTGIKSCLHLKEPLEPLVDTIYKTAVTQYASLFNVTDISKYNINTKEFSVYGKLPNNYKDKFKDETLINNLDHLNKKKATYILSQIRSEDFLKSESSLCFEVANVKVKLKIVNEDFRNSILKVTSMNMLAAFNIRNFIMTLVYHDDNVTKTDIDNIEYTLYNTTENILKNTKMALLNNHSYEEFQPIAENFERNVFGALPL